MLCGFFSFYRVKFSVMAAALDSGGALLSHFGIISRTRVQSWLPDIWPEKVKKTCRQFSITTVRFFQCWRLLNDTILRC